MEDRPIRRCTADTWGGRWVFYQMDEAQYVCKKCGKVSVKEKVCYDRDAAERWEDEVRRKYKLCPECQRAAKRAEGLWAVVRRCFFGEETEAVIEFRGDTYNNRDTLKKLGASWGYVAGSRSGDAGYNAWAISVPCREADGTIAKVKDAGIRTEFARGVTEENVTKPRRRRA